jgi:hypothetical protein
MVDAEFPYLFWQLLDSADLQFFSSLSTISPLTHGIVENPLRNGCRHPVQTY